MNTRLVWIMAALGGGIVLGADAALAQQSTTPTPVIDTARPRDSTANLPSDTGSQATLPRGAVTGAGQPQGRTVQPDVGEPGGLEARARREARTEGSDEPLKRKPAREKRRGEAKQY